MAPTPIPLPDSMVPSNTVGAVEIGMLVSSFLFGLVTCQTYFYYQKFPGDALWLKSLVAVIWALELGHTVANSDYLYYMTVIHYANPLGVIVAPASLGIGIMCSAFIGPLVQAWFAYRVLKFSGSIYVPIACWFLSAMRCASTIAVAIEALNGGNVVEFENTYHWLLIFILTVGAAVDILIASSLCYWFRKHRSGMYSKTMNQLMIWTIETGLLTSVTAVSMLVCFLTMNNYIWIAIFTFLAKLFSNTFLAALNARRDKPSINIIPTSNEKAHLSVSTFGTSTLNGTYTALPSSPRRARRKPNLSIQMSYQTDVHYDVRPLSQVSHVWLQSPTSPVGLAY